MGRESEKSLLHVGVLSLNRRLLFSPNLSTPELFQAPLQHNSNVSVETQAITLLGEHGIKTTSLKALIPLARSIDRGYLLREINPVDLNEHELAAYTCDEVIEYTQDYSLESISGHFLRQVAYYMRPRRHLS